MEKKFVITIGRQLGSGGLELAQLLGQRLGVPVYNKELINEAAKNSGLDPSLFERADEQGSNLLPLRSTAALSPDRFGASFSSGYINNDTLFALQSETIHSVADQGSCIIVGRCADYVLRERENTLNVFLTASIDERAKRVADLKGCSIRQAKSYISQTEKQRASYYNYYTFKTWGAADGYDMCLNSSVLGVEHCAEIVIAALKIMLQK